MRWLERVAALLVTVASLVAAVSQFREAANTALAAEHAEQRADRTKADVVQCSETIAALSMFYSEREARIREGEE